MKTVYVGIDEYIYHCPYCGIEIGDLTGDEIERQHADAHERRAATHRQHRPKKRKRDKPMLLPKQFLHGHLLPFSYLCASHISQHGEGQHACRMAGFERERGQFRERQEFLSLQVEQRHVAQSHQQAKLLPHEHRAVGKDEAFKYF